jgi:DNA-binding NtrC family response regulator
VLTAPDDIIDVTVLSTSVLGKKTATAAASSETSSAPSTSEAPPARHTDPSADLRDARAAFEAQFIADQLRSHGGNVSRTAAAIGISRVMLQKKMKDYGLR